MICSPSPPNVRAPSPDRRGRSMLGGQGRGRTADLPLFRRTLVPTELPARARGTIPDRIGTAEIESLPGEDLVHDRPRAFDVRDEAAQEPVAGSKEPCWAEAVEESAHEQLIPVFARLPVVE